MHITVAVLVPLEGQFGVPAEVRWRCPISAAEMAMLTASKRGWRQHDVTLFIQRQDGLLAVIRKPHFPEGVWRAPSGGVDPGEDFVQGVAREALEETGLRCQLVRYLLRVSVAFVHGQDEERWYSHVFLANTPDTELSPRDTGEIAAARWMTVAELQGEVRAALLASGRSLLVYRVALTDAAIAAWQGTELPLVPPWQEPRCGLLK